MKKVLYTLAASLLLLTSVCGQAPAPVPDAKPKLAFVSPPSSPKVNHYDVESGDLLSLMPDTDCDQVDYLLLTDGGRLSDWEKIPTLDKRAAIFHAWEPKEYLIRVTGAKVIEGKAKLVIVMVSVTVHPSKDPTPGPQPKPIDPPVPPKPVDPVDPPSPIDAPGFRAIFIYQDKDLSKLPIQQQSIFFATEVRKYLNDKCVSDNGQKAYWFIDADAKATDNVPAWVTKAFEENKGKKLPLIVTGNGKTGTVEALPKNITDTISLLKKFGGQ